MHIDKGIEDIRELIRAEISIFLTREFVIPDFLSKTKYSLHVCPGSFIPHTRT
jgi:hypothetical protein